MSRRSEQAVVVLLGVLPGCQSGASAPEPPREGWLKAGDSEKFRQIESQLRGFDVAMMEVGYRFT